MICNLIISYLPIGTLCKFVCVTSPALILRQLGAVLSFLFYYFGWVTVDVGLIGCLGPPGVGMGVV